MKTIICFLTCLSFFGSKASFHNFGIDKAIFYAAMESNKMAEVEEQLLLISKSNFEEKGAYEGALLMKKAGLASKPKDKINLFKKGKLKLEAAIVADNKNAEYRFLRLILQEHAPKIVKYKNNLEEDSKFIKLNFNKLSASIQKLITEYSKNSTILKIG